MLKLAIQALDSIYFLFYCSCQCCYCCMVSRSPDTIIMFTILKSKIERLTCVLEATSKACCNGYFKIEMIMGLVLSSIVIAWYPLHHFYYPLYHFIHSRLISILFYSRTKHICCCGLLIIVDLFEITILNHLLLNLLFRLSLNKIYHCKF